jgi:phage regulator Rha-like protein
LQGKEEKRMNDLIGTGGQHSTITSMEVAEMVGKDHNKLLRDIREYISQLDASKIGQSEYFSVGNFPHAGKSKIAPADFFIESGVVA